MAVKMEEPFFKLRIVLTAGSKSHSRGRTPGCSMEIGLKSPYRPGIQTGSRVRDWAWRNTFI